MKLGLFFHAATCYFRSMLLPFNVASLVAAFLLIRGLNWMALIPWRDSMGMHWTERARRLYPVRIAAILNPVLTASIVGLTFSISRGNNLSHWLPPAVAAWAGAMFAGYWLHRELWRGTTFKVWFGQFATYGILLYLGLLLVIGTSLVMPRDFGWRTWLIAGGLLAVILALIFGVTLAILRATRLIRPAPEAVRQITERTTAMLGATVRHVWVNDGPAAHAFALLPMNDFLFSNSLVRLLSEDELASVCAHEASHLNESKYVFASRVLAILALYPLIFVKPVLAGFGVAGIVGIVVAQSALIIFPRRIARRMEKRADAAARQQQAAPAIYARALEKIYEANQMPAVMPKRAGYIHPDLYDRMVAAGVTPAYERPRPPDRQCWTSIVLIVLLSLEITCFVFGSRLDRLLDDRPALSQPAP